MQDPILYLPLATTFVAIAFATVVARRWRTRAGSPHLAWWALGLLLYGAGTFAEGLTAILGWREPVFRAWYITGALLGGAPLAQGTVYLLLPRRTADRLSIALIAIVAVAGICVLLTPLRGVSAGTHRLETGVIEWTWVRGFSPVVNTCAFIFLVGGAMYSTARHRRGGQPGRRAHGTALIAAGGVLPGIGGSFTRAGYTEVLYVTEFVGLALIYLGYHLTVSLAGAAVEPGLRPGHDVEPAASPR